jgi:pimeloyl-ACP methyl ester carboxylesterase
MPYDLASDAMLNWQYWADRCEWRRRARSWLGSQPRGVGVAEHANHLADWLQAADLPSVAVLGNSFGCQVAVDLAVRIPTGSAAWS